jgi:hypothetical protein
LRRGDVENARDWFERASDPSMMLGHPFAFMESRAQKIIDGIENEGMSCEYLVDKYLTNLSEPSDQDTLSLEDLLIMAILEEEESSKKGKKKKKKKKKARA